jgi:hypothetical protein
MIKINALLLVAGMIMAYGYRVMTAGVIGANIGAGIIIMFGTPLVLGLLVSAAVLAKRSRSSQHTIV